MKKETNAYKLCRKGTKLKQQGKFSEALKAYNGALKKDPFLAVAYYERSDLPSLIVTDGEIARMEKILAGESAPVQDRIACSFALARAFDKAGEYRKAFMALQTGNTLKRQTIQYDPNTIKNDVVILLEAFTEFEFSECQITGHESKAPIFILGMPRSGTTLVEQILSSHPLVQGGGELYTLDNVVKKLYPHVNMGAPRGQRLAGITPDLRRQSGAEYLNLVPSLKGKQQYLTDKMPQNFLHVGWIRLLFEYAKIIHVMRNKQATVLSCYQQLFTSGHNYAYDLDELSQYYDSYELLMGYWEVLFHGRIHRLHYEDLVTNQEQETQKLLQHCDIPWDASCLNFHLNPRAVTTLSTTQVRQEVYRGAIDHWKNYQDFLDPELFSAKR